MSAVSRPVLIRQRELEDAQSKIDDEISTFLAKVADLRSQRNELTLIAFLPIEVLADIFWTAITWSSIDFSSSGTLYRIGQLRRVCKKWNNVVQDIPRLWSQVDMRSDGGMQKMFEMAKYSALELRADLGYGNDPRSARVGFALSSPERRFKRIQIHCTLDALPQICRSLQPECLSQLQCLFLKRRPHFDSSLLPPKISDCLALGLSSMRLDGFTVPYVAPLLSGGGLVHLEIVLPSVLLNPLPVENSIERLVDLLGTLPKLRHLVLEHSLPPIPSTPFSHTPISLPDLSILKIHGGVHECAQLLHFLDVGAGLQIEVHASFKSLDEVNRMVPTFASICNGFQKQDAQLQLHSLSLALKRGVHIIGYRDPGSWPNFDLCLKAAPRCVYSRDRGKGEVLSAMSTFLRETVIGLQALRVDVDTTYDLSWQQCADAFGSATDLQTLSLDNWDVDDIIIVLSVPSDQNVTQIDESAIEGEGETADSIEDMERKEVEREVRSKRPRDQKHPSTLWKNLKHLELSGTRIPYEDNSLVEALESRVNAGCSLESMSIKSCSVHGGTVQALREVIEVEWDGIEDGRSNQSGLYRDEEDYDPADMIIHVGS